MAGEKPKAEITYEGYEVRVGNTICYKKTKEEAEKCAKEWEAEEVREWEERNSKARKEASRNSVCWYKINRFVDELKIEARLAGKRGNPVEVEYLRKFRERLERKIKECEVD